MQQCHRRLVEKQPRMAPSRIKVTFIRKGLYSFYSFSFCRLRQHSSISNSLNQRICPLVRWSSEQPPVQITNRFRIKTSDPVEIQPAKRRREGMVSYCTSFKTFFHDSNYVIPFRFPFSHRTQHSHLESMWGLIAQKSFSMLHGKSLRVGYDPLCGKISVKIKNMGITEVIYGHFSHISVDEEGNVLPGSSLEFLEYGNAIGDQSSIWLSRRAGNLNINPTLFMSDDTKLF